MRQSRPNDGPSAAAPDGGLGIAGQRELRELRRFSHEAMATIFEVHAAHADAPYAAQAAQAAFDLTDRLERDLSRFIPNSDVGRINHLAAGERTRVSPSTMECLVIARHVFDLTGGAFDVSIGTGLPSLELDPDDCVVRATTGGVRIDLGGIGKGYAVDLMAELLEEWGLGRALVHGGFSSVLVLEAPEDRDGWPLTLSDPGDPVPRARPSLGPPDGARGLRVAQGRSHRRPAHRQAAGGRRAAWVAVPPAARLGPRRVPDEGPRLAAAAVADALTTAFMLLIPRRSRPCAREAPASRPGSFPAPAGGVVTGGRGPAPLRRPDASGTERTREYTAELLRRGRGPGAPRRAARRRAGDEQWLARTRRARSRRRPEPQVRRSSNRRDVLKGLSTVPALGLFGYAWQKQRQYQQATAEAAAARPWRRATCRRSTSPCSARAPRARC